MKSFTRILSFLEEDIGSGEIRFVFPKRAGLLYGDERFSCPINDLT